FGVARWELAATAQQARIWYEPFARTVRAALPTTPLGLFLAGGDPAAETKTAADLLVERSLPCDSLAWRAAGGLTEETQTFRRLRSVLAGYPALKSVTLWPRLVAPGSDAASAARCVAQAARWADFGPLDQPNALGGVVSALPETASGKETSAILWNALTALNRVSGTRLRAESDDSGLRGLAARAPDGRLSILIWREGEAQGGELRALLRLHGLMGAARGGLRMEQFLIDAAHNSGATAAEREETTGKPEAAPPPDRLERAAWTDLPANAGDIELPLVFAPNAVMLLELRPHRPPPVQITLSAPRFTYMSGEELPLIVNLRNGTKTPQRAIIQLQSSQAELVPSPLARTALGALAPGASRAFRFRLPVPVVARDTLAFLNVNVGSESRCALAVRLASPLVATLDTPRIDLTAPGAAGTARVRLVNRAKTRLSVTLRASGSRAGSAPSEESVEVPGGGRPVAREVEIAAPARDPGNYPVEITVRDTGGALAALTATVGVPVLCRYAAQMPIIDGDLREWADADPMGMGRREQVGEKEWRGPADLSAVAYAKWDDRFFYFACAVTDDAPFQPFPAAELQRGDSVVFALSSDRSAPSDRSGYGPGDHEIGLALLNLTQPVLYRFAGPPGVASGPISRSVVAIRREGTRLFYEAAIPWTALAPAAPRAGATYGFSVVVNDNDGQGRGYIAWGGGLVPARRPGLFPPLRLVK
ncbi:MAG TPA: sugar-binding protein, partial [Chthonomonadaceae bacterium]|nr:sugar-binding protein [Chthonomonadaceae bacterium]